MADRDGYPPLAIAAVIARPAEEWTEADAKRVLLWKLEQHVTQYRSFEMIHGEPTLEERVDRWGAEYVRDQLRGELRGT